MKILRSPETMQGYSNRMRMRGRRIGFVPTMGYLHEGHLSLVRQSTKENDITIVSIFVNPAQFGPDEDLDRYPRDFKRDEKLLGGLGASAVFYPARERMYPEHYHTYVNVESLTDGLCGRSRAGHFRGVATVVAKLFNITRPHVAYFGQKDAQQAMAIKKMAEDLNMGLKVKILPTVREKDGLAMSSRNTYLTGQERKDAVILHNALMKAREMIKNGAKDPGTIKTAMRRMIISRKSVKKIEYIEIVDADFLRPVKKIKGRVLIALAVWIGKTRLIDNIVVGLRRR